MRERLCTCEAPESYAVTAADGSTVAHVCGYCNRPVAERRRHAQGVVEAAVEAGIPSVLVVADQVRVTACGDATLYEVPLAVLAETLRELVDAAYAAEGGERHERVLRRSA